MAFGFFKFILWTMLVCTLLPRFSTDDRRHSNFTSNRAMLISSYRESLQILDEALLHSRRRRSAPSSSMHMFALLRQMQPETLEIAQAAEVFQTTLRVVKSRARQRYKRDVTTPELLSWEDVELIAELSNCPPPTHPSICQVDSKYRTISGLCNNRQNPLWGAANIAMVRWLPAEYEDGESEPKGWNQGRLYNGFQLPPPNEVSVKIMKSSSKNLDDSYSQMLVEWGQYIDHDLTFMPQLNSHTAFWPAPNCVECENAHPCFPIQIHGTLSYAQDCMPFHRSTSVCFVNFMANIGQALQRQQMNSITSFIDASSVYGHTPRMEYTLRDIDGLSGKLAVNQLFREANGRAYLPFIKSLPSKCLQDPHADSGEWRVECFNAGDTRVNEGMPLITLHTLWLREHNRIADALKRINHHWSPEIIFQETRKIVGALHQIITLRDYVPKIIGEEAFEHYVGPYQGYNPTANPSASNVFATAAFRFGHGTVTPILRRLNEHYQEDLRFPPLRLHDTFFSPWRLVKEGGIDPTLRGIIGTAATSVSPNMLMTDETGRLVVLNIDQHMDLASLNLQRGRDHALPGYNDWRAFCGLTRIKTVDDLTEVVGNHNVAEQILRVYKHPDNIDVWLGGLVEKLLPGSRTGPLFACLIGHQMKLVRDGDRFWWEAEGVFTQQQKAELAKSSLSRIICDNTDIGEVNSDSFRYGAYPSDYVSCNSIPGINLEVWRVERSEDLKQCSSPAKIQNGDFILSSTYGKPVALYSCYHGFKLKGTAAILCEGNQWSNQPPQCTESHH